MKTLILFLTLVQGFYFGSGISAPLSYTETKSTNFTYSLSESDTSQQCKGIAKSTGERCKLRTKYENGYCYLHQDQSPGYERKEPKTNNTGRCNATTKAGTRCKRTAASGSRYCWQHQR